MDSVSTVLYRLIETKIQVMSAKLTPVVAELLLQASIGPRIPQYLWESEFDVKNNKMHIGISPDSQGIWFTYDVYGKKQKKNTIFFVSNGISVEIGMDGLIEIDDAKIFIDYLEHDLETDLDRYKQIFMDWWREAECETQEDLGKQEELCTVIDDKDEAEGKFEFKEQVENENQKNSEEYFDWWDDTELEVCVLDGKESDQISCSDAFLESDEIEIDRKNENEQKVVIEKDISKDSKRDLQKRKNNHKDKFCADESSFVESIVEADESIFNEDNTEEEKIPYDLDIAVKNDVADHVLKNEKNKIKDENVQNLGSDIKPKNIIEIDKLEEEERYLLKCIGEQGISRKDRLLSILTEEYGISKIRAGKIYQTQYERGIIITKQIRIPSRKIDCCQLSKEGKDFYKRYFKSNPKESEVEMFLKEYGNLEMGYGLEFLKDVLEEKGFFQSIRTRAKYQSFGVYNPGLMCIDKKKKKYYIDYEIGFFNWKEFCKKCNKVSDLSQLLLFIVPTKNMCKKIQKDIENWIEEYNIIKKYEIRITTVKSIQSMDKFLEKDCWECCFKINDTL